MSFVNSPKPEYAVDGKPSETKNKARYMIRILGFLILIFGIGLNIYAWLAGNIVNEIKGTAGIINGVVTNGDEEPLAGSIIFVSSVPDLIVETNPSGQFQITNLPTGRHTLIVVNNDIGQEFTVIIQDEGVTQIGTLEYIAPPDK